MSLLDTLRQGIKIADTITKPLQATVTLEHYLGWDGMGGYTAVIVTTLPAVVDWKQKQLRTLSGVLSVSRASVLFLDVAALAVATNNEGVDDRDRITLPDGSSGPIIDMAGFIDAGTEQPLATEVFLG